MKLRRTKNGAIFGPPCSGAKQSPLLGQFAKLYTYGNEQEGSPLQAVSHKQQIQRDVSPQLFLQPVEKRAPQYRVGHKPDC